MEQNTDRMGFALIALSIVAVVLIIMNTIFGPMVKSYFQGLQKWSNTVMNQLNPPQQYTHTAYAYSADGKDRFSTIKPNYNLLKNTKSQSYTSTGTETYNSTDRYLLDGVVADILNKPLTITYNYAITNSSGTWSGTIRPTYGLGGTNQSVSTTNLSGTHKETITLAAVSYDSYGFQISGLPAGTKVTITNLKVEFGSIATPYMPSQSEATSADEPTYIGTYTDTNEQGSQDPTKYTWVKTN